MRIAALADVHCTTTGRGTLQLIFQQIDKVADVILIWGGLTEHGQPEEAHILVEELNASTDIPVLGVLGNHDYEGEAR